VLVLDISPRLHSKEHTYCCNFFCSFGPAPTFLKRLEYEDDDEYEGDSKRPYTASPATQTLLASSREPR
jgi:hypothetical protein